jgi:hypothetical protein
VTEPSITWFRERLTATAGGAPPHLGLHLLMGPLAAQAFPNILRNLEERRAVVLEAVLQKR